MASRDTRIEIHDHLHGHGYSEKIKTMKDMIDPREKQYRPIWHKIFLFCCVVAASLDPLFFYIPVINNEQKCLQMDEKLKNTILTLRSLMDLTYIFHIAFQIFSGYFKYVSENEGLLPRSEKLKDMIVGVMRRTKWWIVLIDILCVLPMPQVMILVYFVKMKGPKSLNKRKFLNFLILLQFVPRIFRIYLSCKEFTRNLSPREIAGAAWAKGLFNFFLYVIASHVMGAVWYFFSVQRESACWQNACRKNEICSQLKYFCTHQTLSSTLIDYLDASCPLNNPSIFNFGMFTPALESKIVYSMDFPRKFFYCFAWGLRNLSSFGSNLTTSAYFWESLFSAGISVIGLLLFIYLIGNLQFSAKESEKRRRKMRIKELDIDMWIRNNEIPKDMRTEIMDRVRQKMHENEEVNVKNLLNILPTQSKKRIKQILCLPILKKVRQLQGKDEKSIEEIFMDHLKPVIFNEHSEIFREGDPLDHMLFFTQGTAWSYSSSRVNPSELERGDFYGEELLEWALGSPLFPVPISKATVKTNTRVEAFALEARDMKKVANSWWSLKKLSLVSSTNAPKRRWGTSVVSIIQQRNSH